MATVITDQEIKTPLSIMYTYRICLVFAAYLLPIALSIGSQRWQPDSNNVRGNSFGLENFLFHGYEEAAIKDAIKEVQKVRPIGGHKLTVNEETKIIKTTTRPKPTSPLPNKQSTLRVTSDAIKKTALPFTVKPEEPFPQVSSKDTKSRIVMRRRKRPYNTAQTDGNGQGPENKLTKTTRHPGSTLNSRITIKTTLSPTKPNDLIKTRPGNIKPIIPMTTLPPETSQEERIQQIEITKVAEQPTPSTIKKTIPPERAYTINLKDFLKQQTETLSLSELLQTQNLSLADLLKGNTDASAIIKAKHMISTASTPPSSTTEFKRNTIYTVEPTSQASFAANRNYDLAKKSNVDESAPKSNHKSSIKTTTSNPSTNVRTNDDILRDKETIKTTRKVSLYTVSPLNFDPQTRINEFRAKLKNYQRRITTKEPELSSSLAERTKVTTTTTVLPVTFTTKATEIPSYKNKRIPYKSSNNPELSLIVPEKKLEVKEKPDKMAEWTSNKLHQPKKSEPENKKQIDNLIPELLSSKVPGFEVSTEIFKEKPLATEILTTSTTKRYDITPPEDFKKPEVKDDLIELLRSGHSAEALKKILHARNMTLEEVLSNREKSTVQSNIEELFASQQTNKALFSTQATIHFDDSYKTSEPDSLSTGSNNYDFHADKNLMVDTKIDSGPNRESKQFSLPVSTIHEESVLNFKPDDLTADTSNNENLAVWKLSEKSVIYGSTYAQGGPVHMKHYTDRPKMYRNTPEPEDDIILLETLERNQETARKYKLGNDDFLSEDSRALENSDRSYIPPVVKSAIIASGVVMGIALFVFIAIFTACGWRQRRIRLRGNSSILSQAQAKNREESKRTDTLTPLNFNDVKTYKKTIEFEDGDSESGTSFAGSYLWSTFKNTFTSRANTLKVRLEKEAKSRNDKLTLRGNEAKKKLQSLEDSDDGDFQTQEPPKIDRTRQVINTSFNFKRSPTKDKIDYFNECSHRY